MAAEGRGNLERLTFEGRAVIDFDPELLSKHDYTGTPVLYPTPSQVRGNRGSKPYPPGRPGEAR
jgi:hypothetical protein